MKRIVFLTLLTAACLRGTGQEPEKKGFKLQFKPILTVYANYHAGLGSANGESGFALDRSYIGLEAQVTERLSGKVVLDVGPTNVEGSDLERVTYVKNAMLAWEAGNFMLDFGLISTAQFKVQESYWQHRYIWKSFQDEYKFGSSADMGILGRYHFAEWLSADLTIINGEGYKKLNGDNKYRYAAGITAHPTKGLTLRGYYDVSGQADGGTARQQNLSWFAGYRGEGFSAGIEYNSLYNTASAENADQAGLSAYATVAVHEAWHVFGRYDDLWSRDDWSDADTRAGIMGVEYTPIRQLKISPNVQWQNPRAGKAVTFLYLNVEFRL